jgi:hypothetical protein
MAAIIHKCTCGNPNVSSECRYNEIEDKAASAVAAALSAVAAHTNEEAGRINKRHRVEVTNDTNILNRMPTVIAVAIMEMLCISDIAVVSTTSTSIRAHIEGKILETIGVINTSHAISDEQMKTRSILLSGCKKLRAINMTMAENNHAPFTIVASDHDEQEIQSDRLIPLATLISNNSATLTRVAILYQNAKDGLADLVVGAMTKVTRALCRCAQLKHVYIHPIYAAGIMNGIGAWNQLTNFSALAPLAYWCRESLVKPKGHMISTLNQLEHFETIWDTPKLMEALLCECPKLKTLHLYENEATDYHISSVFMFTNPLARIPLNNLRAIKLVMQPISVYHQSTLYEDDGAIWDLPSLEEFIAFNVNGELPVLKCPKLKKFTVVNWTRDSSYLPEDKAFFSFALTHCKELEYIRIDNDKLEDEFPGVTFGSPYPVLPKLKCVRITCSIGPKEEEASYHLREMVRSWSSTLEEVVVDHLPVWFISEMVKSTPMLKVIDSWSSKADEVFPRYPRIKDNFMSLTLTTLKIPVMRLLDVSGIHLPSLKHLTFVNIKVKSKVQSKVKEYTMVAFLRRVPTIETLTTPWLAIQNCTGVIFLSRLTKLHITHAAYSSSIRDLMALVGSTVHLKHLTIDRFEGTDAVRFGGSLPLPEAPRSYPWTRIESVTFGCSELSENEQFQQLAEKLIALSKVGGFKLHACDHIVKPLGKKWAMYGPHLRLYQTLRHDVSLCSLGRCTYHN